MEEAAKVRKIYEELVLKKQPETVVQIGSVAAIKAATPGVQVGLTNIAPANGNGHSNGNGHRIPTGTAMARSQPQKPKSLKPPSPATNDRSRIKFKHDNSPVQENGAVSFLIPTELCD